MMTNRDFLKQISTDGLPDAATVLGGEKKPKRSWRSIVAAACAVLIVGAAGTAAAFEFGLITIGPAAERMASMTPEEWEDAHINPPPFDVDVEIEAIEEYIQNLEVITDAYSLQQGEAYNVLGMATVGTMPVYAFCEYDPELWDLCWNPEVSSSIVPVKCAGKPEIISGELVVTECNSDKFNFVRAGGKGGYIEDDTQYTWDTAAFSCAECGTMTTYRISDIVEIKLHKSDAPIEEEPADEADIPTPELSDEIPVSDEGIALAEGEVAADAAEPSDAD